MKKIFKYFIYIFTAYLLIGFFILPLIIKPQLIKIIQSETKAKASIGAVSFNPLIFALQIHKFSLRNSSNKPLFTLDKLYVNLNPTSFLYGALQIKEIGFLSPKIYVVYNKNKTLNLLDIVKKNQVKKDELEKKTEKSLRIIVNRIYLRDGDIYYKDYTRKEPFEFSLQDIGFSLANFDTKNIAQKNAELRLYSQLGDGGFIDLKSKIESLQPFKVQGSLAFEASKLYTEWKYMQDVLKLEVADGKISFNTEYTFNLDDLNATTIKNLHIAIEHLRIKPKNREKDILNLDTLYVNGATIRPLQHNVKVKTIGLHGLRMKVKRAHDKTIDWITYLAMTTSDVNESNAAAPKAQSKPWKFALQNLALEKIAIEFQDKAIVPNVTTTINKLNIYAQNFTLLGEKPFDYQLQLKLNSDGICDVNGSMAHKKLNLLSSVLCKNLDIAHYRPYIDTLASQNLQKYDVALKRALLDVTIDAHVQENNATTIITLNNSNISLNKLLVNKKSTNEQLLSLEKLGIHALALNSATKEVSVGNITIDRLLTKLLRKKNKKFNIADIVIAKATKKVKKTKPVKKTKGFHVVIKKAALRNAKIVFVDKALPQSEKYTLERINVSLQNIDSKKRTWLHYKASVRVNKKGTITADGKLRHTPLKQVGSIHARDLGLADVTPYLQEKSFLAIDDGALSFALREQYEKSKKKPDLRMQGSVRLNSLFVTDTHDTNSSLFSLNELEVKPFTLELFPSRLYVDTVNIDSFYLAAKIDENKTINFAKLMKKEEHQKNQEKRAEKNSGEKKSKFPIKIAKINVTNGSAVFSDYSLPIKFKTNIHNLQGNIYAVSSVEGDTSYVDIAGEVDKYGSTKLKGSIDSFNPKEYTDLSLDFKNLDLHSMSGYSASFAGYVIDSGKLYLDLGYNILHGELHATNNVMIRKIKLGKELEGKDVNHLPLGFVIGLLEDSEGIIDIDMPIEGNVNAPDFKYGALVWKTLGNLIAKAVTSPFKFLGSMMGLNGDDLEFVAFAYGKSDITPPQREKLDQIAKLMRKRPKITLAIGGVYDAKKDREALQLQKLVAMVMKKSGDENSKNHKTALNISMLESVYATLREDDALVKLREKLKKEYSDKEAYARAYQNALIVMCRDLQQVTPQELTTLAKQRAQRIKNYLTEEKTLASQRVVLDKVTTVDKSDDKIIKLPLKIEVKSVDK